MSIIFGILFLSSLVLADKWAVLVSGSYGYENYRHQSDVCHMYQVLNDHHFNKDHIITFMADDIAKNAENPFKGKIFNKNGNYSRNVYEGVTVDYSGFQLNAKLLYAILLGDQDAVYDIYHEKNSKVLKSTGEDTVFIYYIDHGGQGLVMMPNDSVMFAKDLIQTLTTMHENKMYKKLVFYMEACESGSMWVDLPDNLDIYAISSTDTMQSSWATYCPDSKINDVVDGVSIGSCLGEVFSCAWLEQDDEVDLFTLSLQEQFEYAKGKTSFWSTPMQWGDVSFTSEFVGNYISESSSNKCYTSSSMSQDKSIWNSYNNKYYYLKNKYETHKKQNAPETYLASIKQELLKETEMHVSVDSYFSNLYESITKKQLNINSFSNHYQINWECYEPVINKYQSKYGWNDYSLQYTRVFNYLCMITDTQSIMNSM